jgi:hypothetical protein
VRRAGTLLVALAAGVLPAAASEPRALPGGVAGHTALAIGQPAPDLALGDQHGKPVRLADVLARRDFVVVAFYVKAFTGG